MSRRENEPVYAMPLSKPIDVGGGSIAREYLIDGPNPDAEDYARHQIELITGEQVIPVSTDRDKRSRTFGFRRWDRCKWIPEADLKKIQARVAATMGYL